MIAKKKFIISLSVLFLLWAVTAVVSVLSGTYDMSILEALFRGDELAGTIFYKIRIPRVLMATVAGGTPRESWACSR